MTERDYQAVCRLVRERSGISLGPDKQYLVEARLGPLVEKHRLGSLENLVARLHDAKANGLTAQVVEAMATAETSFFRDARPFEALKQSVLPELLQRGRDERTLTIWSAGCASGQEPYSLAMLLREYVPLNQGWTVRLLASDLSQEMLARARRGSFSQLEVNRGLPAALLVKYFRHQGPEWVLAEDIRRRVEFFPLNLAGPWPPLPAMNLIFLRNVLIYMDTETKKGILAKAARQLKPGGYLVLGGAETTWNLVDCFDRVEFGKAIYYRARRAG